MGRPEDSRVKIPALVHFTRLGYEYISIKNSKKGADYDKDTNIFIDIFTQSLNRINNLSLSRSDTINIINEIKIKLDNDDLGQAFYNMLLRGINGIKLLELSKENYVLNDFKVVTEFTCSNGEDEFRPDITVLINGMPLAFLEVKRQNNKDGILAEHRRIEKRFSNDIFKRFVNITQLLVFSNNNEYDDTDIAPIQGAFYATSGYGKLFFNKFREEYPALQGILPPADSNMEQYILADNNLLSIKGTAEYISSNKSDTPTNRQITSLFSKERITTILKYGFAYVKRTDKNGITNIEKHIMRYPQLFATYAIENKLNSGTNKGIIWHTQGSGKTALAYFNVNYLTDYYQRQGKIAKFYFIVDRLDLATQAKNEFEARGLYVETVSSREDFEKNIKTIGSRHNTGEISVTVVNIQKFSEDSVSKSSDYDVNIQRIYFLDEAHRSYNPKGSFLANLMNSDRNAVMIALTGTPLIGDGYNTKDVFGGYFHKYYYNQSIADGYTLKLIREEIETTYRVKMQKALEELEVAKGAISKSDMYAHPKFVSEMVKYIIEDFGKSRISLGNNEIGGMIVCDTSAQAKVISEELNKTSVFSHALILHDVDSKEIRRGYQDDFKKGKVDLLVVYNMLLTGFDASRLKKQYLARVIKSHNLLQTLTRVNRPFKDFRYGYVVDFANIKEEFDKTNKAYFDELQSELGDEFENYSDIFKSHEEIEQDLQSIKETLFLFDTNNVVNFINQISEIDDKKTLLALKRALENYKALFNVMKLTGHEELSDLFTIDNANKLFAEVQSRIAIMNFKENLEGLPV